MRLRDELGPIYRDEMFAPLFSQRGRPAEAPWRLALVSVMQFAERLSDRRAADTVRARIDWKYALGLPLDDSGFDSTVLCEFRARLLEGGSEQYLLDTVLTICRDRGGCMRAVVSGPTRPMCWPPYGRTIAWRRSAKPCAMP